MRHRTPVQVVAGPQPADSTCTIAAVSYAVDDWQELKDRQVNAGG
jgi:hypothetical protein